MASVRVRLLFAATLLMFLEHVNGQQGRVICKAFMNGQVSIWPCPRGGSCSIGPYRMEGRNADVYYCDFSTTPVEPTPPKPRVQEPQVICRAIMNGQDTSWPCPRRGSCSVGPHRMEDRNADVYYCDFSASPAGGPVERTTPEPQVPNQQVMCRAIMNGRDTTWPCPRGGSCSIGPHRMEDRNADVYYCDFSSSNGGRPVVRTTPRTPVQNPSRICRAIVQGRDTAWPCPRGGSCSNGPHRMQDRNADVYYCDFSASGTTTTTVRTPQRRTTPKVGRRETTTPIPLDRKYRCRPVINGGQVLWHCPIGGRCVIPPERRGNTRPQETYYCEFFVPEEFDSNDRRVICRAIVPGETLTWECRNAGGCVDGPYTVEKKNAKVWYCDFSVVVTKYTTPVHPGRPSSPRHTPGLPIETTANPIPPRPAPGKPDTCGPCLVTGDSRMRLAWSDCPPRQTCSRGPVYMFQPRTAGTPSLAFYYCQ